MARYVVFEGKQPGKYQTWEECHAQVTGVPGNCYRKVETSEKARDYVVFEGKQPGIYPTWEKCHAQVNGVPGNCYRKVETSEKAQETFNTYSGNSNNMRYVKDYKKP
eukprot:TRINITY_DN2663_c1_g1_i3.p2 TRINITY_DN2663_c1_g1~~TRINITY_DN2663_c1_g1_i3.p2  ORF type:complete len:107 (-),score=14.87 TRINITY_DN2663_c1_g1_i3:285-605(-)